MRILHVGKFYPPHMGGTEIYTRDLIRRQSKAHEVKVVVSSDSREWTVTQADGAELTRLPTLATFASMPITLGLLRYLGKTRSDIVHIHMPNPLAALLYLLSGRPGKLVLTHHADTLGRPHLRRITNPFVRRVMKHASTIIVTSQRYLDTSNELADFRHKCVVIPLGIDAERFEIDESAEIEKLHHQFGTNLVVAVGRLVEFKGFHVAIEALAAVPEVKLLIVGDGPQRTRLQGLAISLGVSDRVVFLGSLPNERIPAIIKASSVVLFPSTRRTESFGYVQLEALACGVPVINTSIDTAASEVSLHQLTGITVPPLDPQALATAMQQLLANQELRRSYGDAGIVRVNTLFRLDVMADQTLALYHEVLEHTQANPVLARLPLALQGIFKKRRESPI